MAGGRATPWVIGTVGLGLVIGAGAWFLGISPMLDAAAEMNDQAEMEAARVDQLEIQLAGLKADYEKMDEFRADLAALRVQLPAEIDQAALQLQLQDMATGAGVFVDMIAFTAPLAVVPEVAVAPAAAEPAAEGTEEGAAEGTDSTGTAADGTAAAAPAEPTVSNLYALPVELTTVGTFDATLELLNRLQTQAPRLIVVNNVSANALDERGAEGGRPATRAGDLETVIQAWVYVLLDETAAPAAEVPVEEAPLPSGGSGNPFAPTT